MSKEADDRARLEKVMDTYCRKNPHWQERRRKLLAAGGTIGTETYTEGGKIYRIEWDRWGNVISNKAVGVVPEWRKNKNYMPKSQAVVRALRGQE